MNVSRSLATAALVGVVVVGAACTSRTVDETKKDAGAVLDETRAGAVKVIEATQKAGDEAADAMTDGWVTTKVKAKFADETVLRGSDISVDTTDHVVTLKGSVGSAAARARAGEIATGTEGVTRVVNELVVKGK